MGVYTEVMYLPDTREKLAQRAMRVIGDCRSSQDARAAVCRQLRQWIMTGSNDGQYAIYNKLIQHINRKSSYLYSAAELRFRIDFESLYAAPVLAQGSQAARVLTREWERKKLHLEYGVGVTNALSYGSTIAKSLFVSQGLALNLVMPWSFGVYNESVNGLGRQEAMCESTKITSEELWRRISHLPDAKDLYKRAVAYAKSNTQGDFNDASTANILFTGSAPGVQTMGPYTTQPGGFVDIGADYSGAYMSPTVSASLIDFHELWVWDDARNDYTTVQMCEPDVLISPRFKRTNLFSEGSQCHPYSLIQPNPQHGFFWGRSEISNLLKLQAFLRDRLIDIKKLSSVQFDRILAFSGFGMNDERYDSLRRQGWIANEDGQAKVEDLTPEMPQNVFREVDDILRFFDESSGFQPILTGQGEQGVRSGNQAQQLVRTASPHLREGALLVECQLADCADTSFQLLQSKDDRVYWSEAPEDGKGEVSEASEFYLHQLPGDYRISVDSHSSSPIYQTDNFNAAVLLAKAGAVDGEALIESSPLSQKDIHIQRYKDRQKKMQEFIEKNPYVLLQKKDGQQRATG